MGSSPNLFGFCVLILLVFSVNWCESINCSCKHHERNALLSFQKAHIPTGTSSNCLKSWGVGDCCTWEGVGCSKLTCHVVSLNLQGGGKYWDEALPFATMNDILTSALTQLRNLEYLDLSGNQLSKRSDDTPKEFNGKVMNQLRHLDLSHTYLPGQIPHQLGNLSNLQVLNLSDTFLYDRTGFKWVFGLQKLRSLNINNVDLSLVPTNSILQLHRLSTLQELRLSGCQLVHDQFLQFLSNSTFLINRNIFTGTLIPSTLVHFPSLVYLDLSDNNFNGTIPSTIGLLSSLAHLDLSLNHLNGTIPSTLGQLSSLAHLDLSFNDLNGTIPSTFSQLSSLTYLFIRVNNFTGTIPSTLGLLSSLAHLDLSFNHLNGTIPSTFSQLSSLTYLFIEVNNFTGTIPSTLGQLSSLAQLDLSSNNFNGTIPSTLGQLSSLTSLYLSNNNFTGTIPSALGQLSSLTDLNLSNNNFIGTIPSALGQLSSLTALYLYNNNFTGTIPSTLGQLTSLQHLDLSENKLTGVLPDHIHHNWSSLNYLNLAYNHLNGTIPISICYSNQLAIVDMKSNRFSGKIPDCSSRNTLDDLEVVDLSSNSLSGRVPSFLWELPQIQLLNLSNNTLEGEPPKTISKSLEILDLGENDFYGKIPSWNLSMPNDYLNLRILRLRSNHLVGMVPLQMCSFDNLQILDLANNHLTGPIPKCFGNLSGMRSVNQGTFDFESEFMSSMEAIKGIVQEYTTNLPLLVNLDLSHNNFSGSIPIQLTELQKLIGLNVSHNQLTGKIPSQIGRMKSMESLDLSENNLQGSIPQGLADLTSLSSLNLSYNKLYGPIPTGSQLSTFIDPSIYVGNVNLCGDMLPKKCSNDHEKNLTKMALDDDHNGKDPYEKLWFPGFLVLGTIISFWGVIGILIVKQGWRYAYLRLGDEIADWIYAKWMVKKVK